MFVRKKKNKSGTTTVQVVSKADGRFRSVRSFDAARDSAGLRALESAARRFINDPCGATPELFPEDRRSDLDKAFLGFMRTHTNSQLQTIGPELIFGALYDRIGYGRIDSDMFRHLVISRLSSPGSKLKTARYLKQYLNKDHSINSVYRFLDNLCYREGKHAKKPDIKSQVEQATFEYTRKVSGGQALDWKGK